MYIRETRKIDKKTGRKYSSFQLVESIRTSAGPRQKILLTVGSEINLSPEQRKDLANRIEEITTGTSRLSVSPQHIEGLAQHFAKLLLQKNLLVESVDETSSNNSDYLRIDVNSMQHTNIRTIGCENVVLAAYRELRFDQLLTRLNFSEKQKSIAAAAIIGRAIHPYSERSLHKQLKLRSGLDALMKTSFADLSLDQLYHISDKLCESKKKIEQHLAEREKTLFNLQETIILYDITNTYFEGACKKHLKAKRGKSKEMRTDCPLISVGVVLDAEGFPKHSEIFDGNINENATLQKMISKLNRSNVKTLPIVVLDSGIATKNNVDWLKDNGYSYIVMMKKKERPAPESCQDVIIKDDGVRKITASLLCDKETDDYFLRCYSEERRKKELDIQQQKTNVIEKALNELKNGLSKPGGRIKSLAKINQKIGRLREKHARLIQYYDIKIEPAEDGQNAQDITWCCDVENARRSFSGTYTLRTNVKDLSANKVWEIYVMLSGAEACYRCLKSETGLRPNWHHREDRIDGHIFISILAYHLIITIRTRLKDHGICDSWETIIKGLNNHALVDTTFKTEDGAIYLRQVSEPDDYQKNVYRALGLLFKPIKMEKTILKNVNVVSKV